MNPIYPHQQKQPQSRPDPNAMYQEFQKNPSDFLVKCGLNIPADFQGDYRAMVEHLANSGQVPPALRGRVNAMLGRR